MRSDRIFRRPTVLGPSWAGILARVVIASVGVSVAVALAAYDLRFGQAAIVTVAAIDFAMYCLGYANALTSNRDDNVYFCSCGYKAEMVQAFRSAVYRLQSALEQDDARARVAAMTSLRLLNDHAKYGWSPDVDASGANHGLGDWWDELMKKELERG